MNEEERLGSLENKTELLAMNREQLRAELDKALADLEDLCQLRHGFFGQTGVHIGMRVLKSARRQFEREEARLKEYIALLEGLLRRDDSPAQEESYQRGWTSAGDG